MVEDSPYSLSLENFHILLKYIGALMYMSIRKPTRKELNELPVVDLTSPNIWNPREEETNTEQYLVWEHRNGTNVIHCKVIIKPGTPEMEH